jgi:hypothetical protein
MHVRSSEKRLIEWLNTVIVMAQWDKHVPLYFARLFEEPDPYHAALQRIRKGTDEENSPSDSLSKEEWERLFHVTTSAQYLRKLFADDKDPFEGAGDSEISLLASVSDLTTDPQTMFYSQNGTFHLVLSAIRQRPELDTVELITDGLHKFFTLLDTNQAPAEALYNLSCSNDWYPVLASLYDGRDYTANESDTATAALQDWNRNLNTELRSILLKPTRLYRVSKKLIKLAWEKRELFTEALNSIPPDKRLTGAELRQQISNVAYSLFVRDAKGELQKIQDDLQLLAVVARHYIGVRKFAKLDGLVYAWPRIASLAMANYANLEYVEEFFVEKKPRPTVEELEARDAKELYDLCSNNGPLIRFLRLRPYFREIDEDELRHYRPLAPVTISDQPQQPTPQIVSPTEPSVVTQQIVTVTTPVRVCELSIKPLSTLHGNFAEADVEYGLTLAYSDTASTSKTTFSIRKLLNMMLLTIGVTSEESLQSSMKGLFSGTNAEQVLARAGSQLFSAIFPGFLNDEFTKVLKGDGPVRLVIRTHLEELQYLPWEWLPRPGYNELFLSNDRFSLVRTYATTTQLSGSPMLFPLRIMGLFPNAPVGTRDISVSSRQALEDLSKAGVEYKAFVGDEATIIRVEDEVEKFLPQIVHFEGYAKFLESENPSIWVYFSSLGSSTEPVHLSRFGALLHRVQLLVAGRNDSSRVIENTAALVAHHLARTDVPAVLAPIRAVDDVTATSLTTEFYRAMLAGNTVEQALYIARRKIASRGGDWTAFALFAQSSMLDVFQPLPPQA